MARLIAMALVKIGGKRLLWGNDFLHPNASHAPNESSLLELIARFAPVAADRQRFLADSLRGCTDSHDAFVVSRRNSPPQQGKELT